MSDRIAKILSHASGPFWQLVKYGVIGVMSTVVQAVAFYAMASTFLKCLKADDVMVRLLGLPHTDVSDAQRALLFAAATALAFVVSNIFCWLMNRAFVFIPGRHRWWVELALFFAVSATAMVLATLASWYCICKMGMMTTLAALIEVVVSFLFNYFLRKFVIFRG